MWSRDNLKTQAKAVLRANYWKAVLVSLIVSIVAGGYSSSSNYRSWSEMQSNGYSFFDWNNQTILALIGIILSIVLFALVIGIALQVFVFSPILVGCQRFFIDSYKAPADLNLLGSSFKNRNFYLNIVKTMFLQNLFLLLWTLLLIIPGIIKGYEYRMIPYILAENPDIDWKEAFNRSKEMMMGEKWNAFVLDLSFYGWFLLSVFTCGILTLFYVSPYYYLTCVGLYEVLKRKTATANPYQPQY